MSIKRNENLDPILVLNPQTKRHINIAPLLNLVNEEYQGEFNQLSQALDSAAVAIATNVDQMEGSSGECGTILYNLFGLRDTLNCVAEFKEERNRS
jgi:hypothetical protein